VTRAPTTTIPGAFESDGGRAVAGDLVEMLESELVRFRHRVAHDYAISLERARAALVLLTKLVAAGAPWAASPDSAPRRIFDSFVELITRSETTWPSGLAETLHAELADFLTATSACAVGEPAKPTLALLLRHAGAEPEVWWWASQYADDPAGCWRGAATNSERMIAIALALGITADPINRTLAAALAVGAGRAKTKRSAQRTELVALLDRLAAAAPAHSPTTSRSRSSPHSHFR